MSVTNWEIKEEHKPKLTEACYDCIKDLGKGFNTESFKGRCPRCGRTGILYPISGA